MMNRLLRRLLFVACFAAPGAQALEVAEAYAAIPHRRTPYDISLSPEAAAQKTSLGRLFSHTDKGVVLRVEGMKAHTSRDAAALKRVVAEYDALVAALQKEDLVPQVAPARALIVDALKLQQRHFQSRPAGGLAFTHKEIESIPEVRQSSQMLQKAYGLLMAAFPAEVARNRTAFFDHLCALDFL